MELTYSDEQFIVLMDNIWDLKINLQDLQQLKPEMVQKIYFTFLKDCGTNLEKFNQMPYQVLETIHYPDECMGAVRLMMLAVEIRKLFKLIFDDDSFRPCDLFNPRPKRTKKYFAMIFEFEYYVNTVFEKIDEKESQVGVLCESRDKMKARIQKLQQQTAEKREENAACHVYKEQEKARLESRMQELEGWKDEKCAVKAQLDMLNLNLANLVTAKKDMELKILETTRKLERLKGLVIQSDEEQEIKKRDEQVAVLREDNQRKRENLDKMHQKIKNLNASRETLEKLTAVLQEIQQENSKHEGFHTTMQELDAQALQLLEESEDQTQQNRQLTEQLAVAENKLQQMHQVWNLKCEGIKEEIKEQEQMLEDIKRNQMEQDIVCHDLTTELAELDAQIATSQEQVANITTTIENHFRTIRDAVQGHQVKLEKAVSKVGEYIKQAKERVKHNH